MSTVNVIRLLALEPTTEACRQTLVGFGEVDAPHDPVNVEG
jgi:hypothetical protein